MSKSKLQEICQRLRWELPEYEMKREGPDHNPRFQATVVIDGVTFRSRNTCTTVKQAQNEVAHAALHYIMSPSTGSSSKNVSVNNPSNQGTHLKEITEGGEICESIVSAHFVAEHSRTKVFSDVTKESANNTASPHLLQEWGRELDPVIESSGSLLALNSTNKIKDMNHLCKSQLQTYTQKHNLYLPTYIPEREGPPHACRFRCKVVVGEQTFESQTFFPTLREAENAAAKRALDSLVPDASQEGDSLVYKNLLQELAQKRSFLLPVYTTARSGAPHSPTFVSTVEVVGKTFGGQEAKTKKLAEMSAAKVAYMSLTGGDKREAASLSLPFEQQEKQQDASATKSTVGSGIFESSPIRPRKVTPDVPTKWVEVHEEEPLFLDLVCDPANVSSPAEKNIDTSPILENHTNKDPIVPSMGEIANELIMGTGNHSRALGDHVVVRPWTLGMTLPPDAELVFRDDKWVAFRPPKP